MFTTVLATEVTIGADEADATGNQYLPWNSFYKYAYSQQIYTADEIGMAGTINSLTMQLWQSGTAALPDFAIEVYMALVDKEEFANTSDWEILSEDDLVFSGTVNVTSTTAEEVTIELDEPFSYNGSDNLLIAFRNMTGSYVTGMRSIVFGAATTDDPYLAMYANKDASAYDMSAPGTGTRLKKRLVLTLDMTTGGAVVIPCDKPSGIVASDVTAHTATLAWADGSGVYNVEYKKAADADWTPWLTATTLLTADLTGLDANTDYQARVQSVCADNQDNPVSSWKTVSFKTMIGLPFEENFDALSAFPADWKRYSGKLIDDVMAGTTTLGSAVSSGWTFSSSTTGVFESKHMYVNIWSTYKYWVVSPVLPMEDNVQLTFDMALSKSSSAYTSIIPGSQDDDKFVVLISTDSMQTWTILRQWDNAGSEYVYDNIALYGEEVAIDLSAYNGENIQLAFYGASTASGGDNYLHIDNILVDYIPSCLKPTDLHVVANSTTSNSVELEWTANTSEDAWILRYKKSNENAWQEVNVTENPYLLENLDAYTNYDVQVAALCDPIAEDGMSKYSRAVSFKTAAVAPFAESFNATTLPGDWKRYKVLLSDVLAMDTALTTTVSAGWMASSTKNGVFPDYNGHLKLQVYGDAVQHWIVSPFIEMDENMQLTFDLALTTNTGNLNAATAGDQADDKFAVLITTDGGESWEEIYTRDNVTTDPTYDQIRCSAEGETVAIDLTAYATDKIAFAFYGESTEAGGNNYLHIANVRIDTIPDCEKPTGLEMVGKSDTSATFRWDEVEGATWSYALVADTVVVSEEDFVGTTQDFTITFDTLQENTSYAFYLRQDCGGIYSDAITCAVTTFPAPIHAPWAEDFEAMDANTIPEFWDNSASSTTTVTGTNPQYVWGVYSYGSNKMIRMYNYFVSSGTAVINTPNIVLPADPAYELTFDYAHTATCGDFSVKISADGGASWATLPGTYSKTSTGTDKDNPGEFSEAQVNLADYAGSTIMLQFFANANYGSGAIFVDNISIHEVPSCLKPQGLVVENGTVSTNSVELEWVPQGSEANWLIQYKMADAEEWTVFDGDVNVHPFTLTGLSASSTYNIRVAAWCDPTDSLSASEYSSAISVTTACDVINEFPYTMNFDGMEGVTSGNVLPVCWDYINTVTGSTSYDYYPTVYKGSTYANSGTNSLKLLSYYNYEGEMYAILPEMEGLNTLRMKFNARKYSASTSYTYYDATFVVGVLNNPTDTANFVALDTITPATTTYEPFEVKFNTYEGTGKYIAIKMVSPDYTLYDYNGAYIDDIVIDPIPDCIEPTIVKVVKTEATSVRFTYTAEEGDSLSYAIVLKGVEPTEFVGVTADTVLVEGLEAGSEYEVYLRTECATSHSVALKAEFQTKQLPIDLGNGFADDFEGENLWTLENGNAANTWVIGTAAHNGQTSTKALYITNDGGATHAYANSASTVYAYKSFNFEEGTYSFKYDWIANGEGSYDLMRFALVPTNSYEYVAGTAMPTGLSGTGGNLLATELPEGWIALDGGKQNLSTAWTTYESVEMDIPAGTYDIVFLWRNDGSGGTQPSAAVDNFSIMKVLCYKPTDVTIAKANITSTTAEIAWTAEEGQTAWQIAMDTIAGFNPDTLTSIINATANPYLAEGLLPEQTYYVYVRANCGENYSAWTARASFKTAKACQKPDGLEVSAITDSSAVVTWNTYGQTDFILTYGIGNAYADTVTVTGGTYTIMGLDANTSYKVKVAAECDAATFSTAKTFKTACSPATTVVENFDGIAGSTSANVLPDCWNYLNGGTTYAYLPTAYEGASYANSGSNSLKFYTYAGTAYADQYAILPAVEGLNGLRMKFNARKYLATYDATIVVGIMTDPADAATFVAIDTIRPAAATYEPFMVSFGEYAGEGMYAAFKVPVPATSYNGAYIDDVELEEIPSCIEPTSVAVSEIGVNSAKLDWVSAASEWQICLNGDEENLISVTAKPYVLNELTSVTNYEFKVRAICAEGDTSAWSKSVQFLTECDIIATYPWSENFNGLAAGIPLCWDNSEGTTTTDSYKWNRFANSTDTCLRFNSYSNSNNKTNVLATPEFALTEPVLFSFDWKNPTGGAGLVMISNDGGLTMDTLASALTGIADWTPFQFNLSAYTGDTVVIYFHGTSNYGSGDAYLYLDNVVLEILPACPKSTGLRTVMVGDTLATLAWDNEEDVAWEYGLVLDTAANFVPADADFTGVTFVNEVTIDTLAPQTAYLFFMRKVCGNDKSPIVYKSFSTVMTATALPYDEDFENGNSWLLVNGTMTNAWTVGTAATESGNALYISNDGGTTFEYTVTAPVIVYAAKAFNFDKAGSYTVSYDWRANGESNYDYLRVALVPADVELVAATAVPSGFSTTGLPTGWKALDGGSKLNLSDAWQNKSVVVENIVPGYYQVVFAWRNDNSSGSQNPAAVDNIHIQHLEYPTGMGNATEGVQAQKFIYNNQVYILLNGVVYDVTGRKVEMK